MAETGLDGACSVGVGTDLIQDITISPDGKAIYALGRETIGAYERHSDGSLSQINCISETGSFGKCVDGDGLDADGDNFFLDGRVFVSPDSKFVYTLVESFGGWQGMLTGFKVKEDGSLEQLSGTGRCSYEWAADINCVSVPHWWGISDVQMSPDGLNFYATNFSDNTVVVLRRDPTTGLLSQPADDYQRCISSDAVTDCKPVSDVIVKHPVAIDVTPDGKHVYVGSHGEDPTARDVVAAFTRNGATGELSPVAGPSGCASASGSGGQCLASSLGNEVRDVAVGPDGRNLYVSGGRIVLDPQTGAFSDIVENAGGVVNNWSNWEPQETAFTSDGRFAYSQGFIDNYLYRVTSTGDLKPLYLGKHLGSGIAISPDDKYLYTGIERDGYAQSEIKAYSRVLDADPPATRITKAPRITKKRTVKISFRSDEAGSTFKCKLDRRPRRSCVSPTTSKHLRLGRHTFRVWATDAAKNSEWAPAVVRFKVVRG